MADRFSIRMGLAKPHGDLAEQEMPPSLRSGLWDACCLHYLVPETERGNENPFYSNNARAIWHHFLREPLDTIPNYNYQAQARLRKQFFDGKYHYVYDFVEFLGASCRPLSGTETNFRSTCNLVLERERAAFRFVGEILLPVTDPEARSELSSAIESNPAGGVREHIRTAAVKYRDNPPDYRNSIKESVSAIEAAVFFYFGRKSGSLGKPLKEIASEHDLHPAFVQGLEKLFAYTSDADGIRHAIMAEKNITQAEARFMLVACAAFANYIVSLKS